MPKVLIVDDSLTVRKVVERILESRHMQVLQASLGTEAIERIQQDEPDLVVCDVLLPDREGYEVCQFVKSHPRLDRTPVLLISGIVNPAVVARAARVGSAGVMQKPFSAGELAGKVSDLLGMPAPVSSPPATLAVNGLAAAAAAASAPRAPVRPDGFAVAAPPRLPERPVPSLDGCLAGLAGAEGVHSVVLADRGGHLIGSAGDTSAAVTLGALAACLVSASDELGAELERGGVQGLIFEHARGLVLVSNVGESAVLTLVLDEPAALGKARYYVKKAVPDLLGAL
jgi:CheY-like chemotaxis protein/predicted regulator of Ras-like GTPase activity (Roadblock/LC7/MglB family)